MQETGSIVRLGRMPYVEAWEIQKQFQDRRIRGEIPDTVLFVEHPPTYTIGRSGSAGHLLVQEEFLRRAGFDLVYCDRGGDITYHGPGQIVVYPILDLRRHGRDVHLYLRILEDCIIRAIAQLGIAAGGVPGLTGVWVGEQKIASIGVRVVRWVTSHGFALNADNAIEPFLNIVPCGIQGCRMTSLRLLMETPVDRERVIDLLADSLIDAFHLHREKEDSWERKNRAPQWRPTRSWNN